MTQRFWITGSVCLSIALLCGRAHADENVAAPSWPRVELSALKIVGAPQLEMRGATWTALDCVMPCVRKLDPSLEYRISGAGVVDSDPFRLPAGADRVRVDVSPGSTTAQYVGTYLMIGGLLFAAAGGTVLLWPTDAHATSDDKRDKMVVGVGTLALGALAAGLGLALRILSDTDVKVAASEAQR